MTYSETLKRALKVLIFDETSLDELANDKKATGHGFLTLAMTGAILGILYVLAMNLIMNAIAKTPVPATFSLGTIVFMPVMTIIGFIIGYSIYHVLAKIFGGQATGAQYFRSLSNVMIVTILSIIPIINYLVSIYVMIVNGFVLVKVHKLAMWKAVVVVLIPFVAFLSLAVVYLALFFPS